MNAVSHWDDVEEEVNEQVPLHVTYQDLGSAAGSVEIGAGRWRPQPGNQSTPAHVEGGEEEIHHILAGSGWSWQDGTTYEVAAGDTLVHLIDGAPHTLVAGDGGLDVIAFGERASRGAHTWLPRAGVVRIQDTWVEAPGGDHPWEREAAAGLVELGEPAERPASIVALDDLEVQHTTHGQTDIRVKYLSHGAGAKRTGLTHQTIAPGAEGWPPHVHSAEEELYVVLAGDGVLILDDDETPVRAGSLVARPAGSRVAHSFRAGADGLVLLSYGQTDPRDMCWYPRSQKIGIAAFGLRFRVGENLDYWDGEPAS